MTLYKFFSCNVEVQYKSYFLSKAMLFTLIITLLTILLPFLLANRARGFWLRNDKFYEHPSLHFTYDYLLYMETDDAKEPIICTDVMSLRYQKQLGQENCAEFQVEEEKCSESDNNCQLNVYAKINLPTERVVTMVTAILGLDFQIKGLCPLHMQSFAVINKDIPMPSSGLKYRGDLYVYQNKLLPCHKNHVDTRFNMSIFNSSPTANENILDHFLDTYVGREVTTRLKTINSRRQAGYTGSFELALTINIPEVQLEYTPSFLQEIKHAWPQYLSFVIVFNWIFSKIKKFVFNNRLLLAWEVVPWKKR